MRKELIEYLAGLFVADPIKSGIVEAGYFSLNGYEYGNSTSVLVETFRDLGVLWHEYPETASISWQIKYKSDRKDFYIKPYPYNVKTQSGKTRLALTMEALEFLEKETKAFSDIRMPVGIEDSIKKLALMAKSQDHEDDGLTAINRELNKDNIQLIKSLSGNYEFEYGIVTDPNEPLYSEADTNLKKLERGYRELIKKALSTEYPDTWESKLGLTDNRLEKIKLRMKETRECGENIEKTLLLDYSDFYDLITITKKCWSHLSQWLEDLNETCILLSIIHPLRNDMAHSRGVSKENLMLIIGITSRLSEKIIKGLMSKKEEGHNCMNPGTDGNGSLPGMKTRNYF